MKLLQTVSNFIVTTLTAVRTGENPVDELARELRRAISGEVRFDEGSRAMYRVQ